MRRILAIGGGGFMMEDSPSPVDKLIRDLTEKAHPNICYLATPSGDLPAPAPGVRLLVVLSDSYRHGPGAVKSG